MRTRVLALAALSLAVTPAAAAASSTTEPAPADDQVVIYSGRTEELVQPLLDRFEDETAIDVEVRYGDTADLALLIAEEGDQSPADVFLAQSPGAVAYLDNQDLLGELPAEILDLVPAQFHATDGSWVGFSGRQRVLAYHPELVAEDELPGSVLEMTDPQWSGRLGIAPTNASFQDFVSAMRVELGDDVTQEWLEGLAANDVVTYPGNSAIVEAIGRGEVDAGLVNHYYVHQAQSEDPDFPAANHQFAPDDVGSLVIVTGAAVLADADHPEAANELVAFLLDEESQRYFSDVTFEYPLADVVAPAEVLPDVDLTAASEVEIDFADLGADLDSTREMIRDAGLES